ncbi:MAG: LytTR family DNA-binding domain-containing protein [Cyclobacteriaceae bacterium]
MKVLIVEDENLAVKRLTQLVAELRPEWEVAMRTDAIEDTVAYLSKEQVDLIFLDIQLSDGVSFEIFNHVAVEAPVIFTTAYDEYAIKAFKVNSVDYLLKPLSKQELESAIIKFESGRQEKTVPQQAIDPMLMQNLLQQLTTNYKERFVIKVGEHIKTVATDSILYFISQQKVTYLMAKDGKRFIVDFTLDKVEELLDPKLFYRINRKMIIHDQAIEDIVSFSNSRLKLFLMHCDNQDSIVARERVSDFKEWLDR